MSGIHPRGRLAAATLAVASLALAGMTAGCSTTGTDPGKTATPSSQRTEINAGADATLSKLYANSPDSRALVSKAKGVLVFPSIIKAGFLVGAEYGRGVLRVDGKPSNYYSIAGGSFGLQAGAQSSATVLLFMTDDALAKFRASSGWTVGADATVAIAKVGVNGSIDTNTARQPIIGFVMNNAGLMAGVSIEGTKITPLKNL